MHLQWHVPVDHVDHEFLSAAEVIHRLTKRTKTKTVGLMYVNQIYDFLQVMPLTIPNETIEKLFCKRIILSMNNEFNLQMLQF